MNTAPNGSTVAELPTPAKITPLIKGPSCTTCLIGQLPTHVLPTTTCKITNTYEKGQYIFYEGNLPLGIYCLRSGKVKLHKSTNNGKTQILRIATSGDLLGYRSLLAHQPYAATAVTMEKSEICFLAKDAFFHVLEKYPATTLHMLTKLSRELGEAEQHLFDIAHKPVMARLANLLLTLIPGETLPGTKQEPIVLDLSREELAELIATTPETVIRCLSLLKKRKIIRAEGRELNLLKPILLRHLTRGTIYRPHS